MTMNPRHTPTYTYIRMTINSCHIMPYLLQGRQKAAQFTLTPPPGARVIDVEVSE